MPDVLPPFIFRKSTSISSIEPTDVVLLRLVRVVTPLAVWLVEFEASFSRVIVTSDGSSPLVSSIWPHAVMDNAMIIKQTMAKYNLEEVKQ
jgi:hypothetical protein